MNTWHLDKVPVPAQDCHLQKKYQPIPAQQSTHQEIFYVGSGWSSSVSASLVPGPVLCRDTGAAERPQEIM
jgi:hypothetical protein